MNGTQIMDKVIGNETAELDSIKSQMAVVLDGMLEKIPAAKAQGISDLDLKVMADTTIRRQFAKIKNGKEDYFVERNGNPAIMGLGKVTENAIVDMFNRQI